MPMHLFLRHNAVLARCMLSSCVCLSVPTVLSVTIRYCIETTGRIELFLATMFPLSSFPLYLHCVIRKFGNLQKYGYVHLEVCPQTLDLNNFATTSRSCCLRLPSWSTVELVEHTYTTAVDASWLGRLIFAPTGLVTYTFVDRTAPSPLLLLLLLLLYYVITHKVQ